jgi:hypothetical protein
MSFHDQDRSYRPVTATLACHPERSEGSLSMGRSFATLRMTGPGLMVKNHDRAGEWGITCPPDRIAHSNF